MTHVPPGNQPGHEPGNDPDGTPAPPVSAATAPGVDFPGVPRPPKAALPLLVALGLGGLAFALTDGAGGQAGLNALLWTLAFAGACLWAVRRAGGRPTREGVTLLGVAGLFGVTFTVWQPPGEFGSLNVLAFLLALTLGAAALRFPGLGTAGLWALIGGAFTGGLRFLYGFVTLAERFPWARVQPRAGGQTGRWGVGVLLALPVLLVFGALLAGADQGFARLVSGWLDWNMEGAFDRAFTLAVWTFLAGGLVYPALMALRPTALGSAGRSPLHLGLIEVGVPLGSLAGLFVVFLLTQLPYYLSGSSLPDGVTFAAYIRRGFGELMTVAFLTVSLLLAAHALTRPDVRSGAAYRALNLAVLLPLVLLILSAANRWRLYHLAYGLTETRLLGAAFLVWVTFCVGWLAWLLWRGEVRRFAYPALLAGFAVLLGTTALNPGALIARVNVDRDLRGVTNDLRTRPQRAQAWHLIHLGAGAVPVLVAHLNDLTPPACGPNEDCPNDRQAVIDGLHDRYDAPRDPRAWNAAYARAHALVKTLPPRSPLSR